MAEKLDVVVFGATGKTGKHVIRVINKMAKESEKAFTWGIAGRSEAKLKNVLNYWKKKIGEDFSNIRIIIADVKDVESLKRMTEQARVIVNCCGPFMLYGEPVVKSCIETGTHLVDVSGEPQYMEKIHQEYNKAAIERGVYIVSACGFGSIPCELGIVYLQKKFEGTINSIETYLETKPCKNITPSCFYRGSCASSIYSLWLYGSGLIRTIDERPFKPNLYPEHLSSKPELPTKGVHKSSILNDHWTLPYKGYDKYVNQRSQNFFYEHDKKRPAQIETYFSVQSLFAVIYLTVFGSIFGFLTDCFVGRALFLRYPKKFFNFISGESKAQDESCDKLTESLDFAFTFVAKGWPKRDDSKSLDEFSEPPNKTIVAKVSGTEPGYGLTAIMFVACALTCLHEADKMPETGGVYSPGAAFANTSMIKKLSPEILNFEVVSIKEE